MKHFWIISLLLTSIAIQAQNQDFEQTGFAIKAVAMQDAPKTLLTIHIADKEVPSRFTLGPVLRNRSVSTIPLVYRDMRQFSAKNIEDPKIAIAPLKAQDVFAFGQDGRINAVKNIAYKPAQGGNIYDAYCRAAYALRSGN